MVFCPDRHRENLRTGLTRRWWNSGWHDRVVVTSRCWTSTRGALLDVGLGWRSTSGRKRPPAQAFRRRVVIRAAPGIDGSGARRVAAPSTPPAVSRKHPKFFPAVLSVRRRLLFSQSVPFPSPRPAIRSQYGSRGHLARSRVSLACRPSSPRRALPVSFGIQGYTADGGG